MNRICLLYQLLPSFCKHSSNRICLRFLLARHILMGFRLRSRFKRFYECFSGFLKVLIHFSVINNCLPNPCKYGGRCINRVGGYTCRCRRGYTGVRCGTGNLVCFYTTFVGNQILPDISCNSFQIFKLRKYPNVRNIAGRFKY